MKIRKIAVVLLTVIMCMFIMPAGAYAANTKGITLNKTNIALTEGRSYTLERTVTGFKSATVLWRSSDSTVASVSKGKITAKKVGNAVITATIKGTDYKATCKVKVKSASSFASLDKFAASDLDKLTYTSVSAKKSKTYDFAMGFAGAESVYVDAETTDGSLSMKMAFNIDGDCSFNFTEEDESVRLIIKGSKVYLLDPASKIGVCTKLSDDEIKEYQDSMKKSFSDLSSIDKYTISEKEKVKTCTVTIDGEKYTVERFENKCILFDAEGSIYAMVDKGSSEVNVLLINEYTTTIPANALKIPSGYEIMDLDE